VTAAAAGDAGLAEPAVQPRSLAVGRGGANLDEPVKRIGGNDVRLGVRL
jgi:hypothetical protein